MAAKPELVSHVVRRCSMGAFPDLVAELADVDAAIARVLDLSAPAEPFPLPAAPVNPDEAQPRDVAATIGTWIDRMRTSPRLIEERLVWFWHDHFATSIAKVRVPYLMAQQHVTVRAHATGSFADLLHAMAKDPAMLVYLDGTTNAVGAVNENFGRECLELFTMGIGGGYTQDDVVDASRAFSGWVVHLPGRRFSPRLAATGTPPWGAVFLPQRHDGGDKSLLGSRGALDLDQALDVILEHPATARFVASKLHRELVGLDADDATAERLGRDFARDWSIMSLVEAIVAERSFTSDAALRARVRTPVERLVAIVQAAGETPPGTTAAGGGAGRRATFAVGAALRTIGYIPFVPPNVGGFPDGQLLIGPHQLVHTFDLLAALPGAPAAPDDVDGLLARFGLFEVGRRTRDVIAAERDPARRFALAAMSPEFALT